MENFEAWFGSLALRSFSYRDIIGADKWEPWTVTYSFTTATSLVVTGRYRVVGRKCEFQGTISGTLMALTAGTSYIALPMTAAGLSGFGVLHNDTTKVSVGTGPIDIANSRFYPPTQAASANSFSFYGSYEV